LVDAESWAHTTAVSGSNTARVESVLLQAIYFDGEGGVATHLPPLDGVVKAGGTVDGESRDLAGYLAGTWQGPVEAERGRLYSGNRYVLWTPQDSCKESVIHYIMMRENPFTCMFCVYWS